MYLEGFWMNIENVSPESITYFIIMMTVLLSLEVQIWSPCGIKLVHNSLTPKLHNFSSFNLLQFNNSGR